MTRRTLRAHGTSVGRQTHAPGEREAYTHGAPGPQNPTEHWERASMDVQPVAKDTSLGEDEGASTSNGAAHLSRSRPSSKSAEARAR
jgi:hypothetical protein